MPWELDGYCPVDMAYPGQSSHPRHPKKGFGPLPYAHICVFLLPVPQARLNFLSACTCGLSHVRFLLRVVVTSEKFYSEAKSNLWVQAQLFLTLGHVEYRVLISHTCEVGVIKACNLERINVHILVFHRFSII